ncbi:MAG: flagellar biosynthesis anti-sigma factor FlgM [Deltaproteobacteria bacterium]|jgi:flagellar biosynthesis anti-sigma factor FlgM
MKIGRNDYQQQPISSRRAEGAAAGQGVRGPGAAEAQRARGVGSEAVKVSDLGRQLAAARGPEVPDEARIERLRGLLGAGRLPVDSGAISDAIMREER